MLTSRSRFKESLWVNAKFYVNLVPLIVVIVIWYLIAKKGWSLESELIIGIRVECRALLSPSPTPTASCS